MRSMTALRAGPHDGGVLTGHEESVMTRAGPGVRLRRSRMARSGWVMATAAACCRVEISASVDSAPWLRLGPSACRPS